MLRQDGGSIPYAMALAFTPLSRGVFQVAVQRSCLLLRSGEAKPQQHTNTLAKC
jgi:hypothetical protein